MPYLPRDSKKWRLRRLVLNVEVYFVPGFCEVLAVEDRLAGEYQVPQDAAGTLYLGVEFERAVCEVLVVEL